MDWPNRYAEALGTARRDSGSLTDAEVSAMLRLAREVAHRTERKNAPVATYVAGRHVAARVAGGLDLAAAVEEVLEVARTILPPEASPD